MNVCSIDWGIVASFAQVGAILGTGGAAIWVAQRQLSAYNKALSEKNAAERVRLSMKVMDDLHKLASVNAERISPMSANDRLRAASADNTIQTFQRIQQSIARGNRETESNLVLVDQLTSAAIVVTNYFTQIEVYLEQGLLEERLVVRQLGYLAMNVFPVVEAIAPPAANLDAFSDFVKRAITDTESAAASPAPR